MSKYRFYLIITLFFLASIFFIDIIYSIQKFNNEQLRSLSIAEHNEIESDINIYIEMASFFVILLTLSILAFLGGESNSKDWNNSFSKTLELMADNINDKEKEIRIIRELSHKIIEEIPDSIAVIDDNYNLILKNTAFEALIKPEKSEIHFLKKSPFWEKISLAIDNNKPIEYTEISFNRHIYKLSINFFILENSTKKNTIIQISDITNQKKIEEHLFKSEKLHSLERLSAGLAHEISNPLAIIYSNINYIIDYKENNFFDDELDTIRKQVRRTQKVLKSFRNITSGAPVFSYIDIEKLIKECIGILHSRLKNKKIFIVFKALSGGLKTRGRSDLLRQVFINLFNNSIDAMENEKLTGNITVNASKYQKIISISISDEGPGIPENKISNIMEPFFTTKGNKGSGLGLFIAYTIISHHKGDLFISNREDDKKGAVAIVTLPLIEKEET